LTWIIFLIYWLVFSWLITKVPFFKRSGLSNRLLISLFSLKIIGGLLYIAFYSLPQYRITSDTWKLYHLSISNTDLLLRDPAGFIKSLFTHSYNDTGNLFLDDHSYWNDLKNNLFVKLFAIINVFTGKNYYAAIVFFNFIFFFGIIAFYRLMHDVYPSKKWLIIAGLFGIPSFLFWCSGVHKDGLIFSALGLIFLYFHLFLQKKYSPGSILTMLFCILLVFGLRNYLALALVPVLFIGWLMNAFPTAKATIAVMVLAIGIT